MAWVETRITRTSQPQDACGVDWSGVPAPSFLWAVLNGSERSVIGETSSRQGAGTHALLPTQAGIGLSSNGAANYIRIANNQNIVAPSSNAFTVMQVIRLNATGQTNKYSAIQFRRATTPSSQQAIIYGFAANTFEFYSDNFTGTNPRTGSGIVVNDTLPHVIVYSYDGTTWSGYLDGRLVFSVARTFTLDLTAAQSSPESALLAANTGTNALNATLLLHAAWPTGVSPRLLPLLAKNPWQIFEPEVSRIWVDDYVSAGGGATTISSDASASYAIRAAITSDAAASYPVRSATSSDTTAAYPLRAATQSDTAAAYAIRSAASADALASYYVLGLVQSDTAGSYAVRSAAQSDALASYAVRSAVQSDALAGYEILSAGVVVSDSPASYAIRAAVQTDGAASYPVRSVAQADAAGTYAVRAAVWSDAGASYAVQGALVAVWADATASYFVDGVVASGVYPSQTTVLAGVQYGPTGVEYTGTFVFATPGDIAAAVLASLQATAIPVNMTQVKGQPINGAGSEADPWGP